MYSKILVVFIVVYFLSSSAHGQDKKFFRQNYTYIEALGSFYKTHKTPKNWFDANQVCAQEGASLFYPENDNEAHTVTSFFKDDFLSYSYIHVGLSDLLLPGVYSSNDGKSICEQYHNWAINEPSTYSLWNCVKMEKQSPHKIYVDTCRMVRRFICKKKLQSVPYPCHFDYTFNSDTGNFYKLHTTPLNWAAAYAACRNEHSYLAVINNQLEADFLANLTMYASYPRVGENYSKGMYHLGFHNKFRTGWFTVKGTLMNVERSAWWDHDEPIIDEFNQCGSMFYNGRLINISCDTKSFFICEHEAHNSNSSLEIETNTQY